MRSKHLAIIIIIFVFLTLFIQFGSAVITRGNPFFNLSQETFGKGQILDGALNFSLSNEHSNTIVNARIPSFDINVNATLLKFLQDAGASFNCFPEDCNITYNAVNQSAEKTANLNVNEKYFGFQIYGNDVDILNLSFKLSGRSSSQAICGDSPLKIDLLDDNAIDFEYKEAEDWCSSFKSSECFDTNIASEESILTSVPYCERIKLKKTGRIEAASQIKLNSGDASDNEIMFFVSDMNGNIKGKCGVEYFDSSSYDMTSCVIDAEDFYIDKEDYYYVCVNTSSASEYFIKKESQPEVCGFYGNPPKNFLADYAIYAREAKFAPFSDEAVFDNETFLGADLKNYVQNYIDNKYNKNCSQGCVIPLRIISLAGQNLTLDDLYLKFQTQSGPTSSNLFYDLNINYSTINMTMQPLSLTALNITLPESSTKGIYKIYAGIGSINGDLNFKIDEVPEVLSLVPTTVVPNTMTRFIVSASVPANRNISEYIWEWGDGTSDITTSQAASHTYYIGTYTLNVKVKDNIGLVGSKNFIITSNLTKEQLAETIDAMLLKIDSFNLQYSGLESWYVDLFDLNITSMNNTLIGLKSQVDSAQTEELVSIKQQADDINMPISVNDSLIVLESAYIPDTEKIEPSYIGAYNETLKAEYQSAIALWQQDNLDMKVSEIVRTVVQKTGSQDVSLIKIKIEPKQTLSNAYLIIRTPEGVGVENIKIKNAGDFDVSEEENALKFSFTELDEQEIEIAVKGRYDLGEIAIFASPNIDELDINQQPIPEKRKVPYGLAVFFAVLIIIAVLVVLWLIWRNYASNVNKNLFKNSMDLYVLTNYISGSLAKGIPKSKIHEQLIKAKWTKQQIKYAWKKIDENESSTQNQQQ